MIGLLLAGVVAYTACAPYDQVSEMLKGVGEKIVSIGRHETGYVLTWATKDGSTWSIVSVTPDEKGDPIACFLGDGHSYSVAITGQPT